MTLKHKVDFYLAQPFLVHFLYIYSITTNQCTWAYQIFHNLYTHSTHISWFLLLSWKIKSYRKMASKYLYVIIYIFSCFKLIYHMLYHIYTIVRMREMCVISLQVSTGVTFIIWDLLIYKNVIMTCIKEYCFSHSWN